MTSTFFIGIITLIAIYATLTLALDLQFSYASLINLGIVAYVAVGAYTYSIVTQVPPGPFDDYKFGFEQPIWVGLIAAALAGLVFGALTGWPSLRLRGEYLALMTFASRRYSTHSLSTPSRSPTGSSGSPACCVHLRRRMRTSRSGALRDSRY